MKAVFLIDKINKEKIKTLLDLGASGVFVNWRNVTSGMIETLHRQNLKVFTEVGIFAGEELLQKYKDAWPIDKKGKKLEGKRYGGVCPNHPKIRQEKLKLIEDLITNLDLDGLWLDFIRYPCHWETVRNKNITEYCYCTNCLKNFKKSQLPWVVWKCQQITDFVEQTKNLLTKHHKEMLLGMFSVPWKENEFGRGISRVIGQDFKLLSSLIDVFSPMVYQKFCGRKVGWISEIVKYMSNLTKRPIWPIIQTEEYAGEISPAEFKDEVDKALKSPSDGAIVFFLEDLIKDKIKTKIIKERFNERKTF